MALRNIERAAIFASLLWLGAAACSSDSSSGAGDDDASGLPDGSNANPDGSPTGDSGPSCNIAECFRPVNCRATCSGPVVASGCCPCSAPYFDDICCANNACP